LYLLLIIFISNFNIIYTFQFSFLVSPKLKRFR
jgi:hypothetical protein